MIEWTVPASLEPSFNFSGLCNAIRCDGYFQSDDIHIPYAEIITIGVENNVVFVANAPATETKQ